MKAPETHPRSPTAAPRLARDLQTILVSAGLWLALFCLVFGFTGCASPHQTAGPESEQLSNAAKVDAQIGFQPAGHDNTFKVADTFRAGDDAQEDLIKDNVVTTMALQMQGAQIEGLKQKLAESQAESAAYAEQVAHLEQRHAGRNFVDLSGGGLILVLLVVSLFAIDRWTTYRKFALSQATAISTADARNESASEVLDDIRPSVRRMGTRRKKLIDKDLEKNGCLRSSAPVRGAA